MRILIIDANNTMHRAYHAYRNMQNGGKPVNIIYGMPILVNGLINQFKPDKTYMCWDGSKDKNRLNINPDYKKGRREYTEEERKAFDKQKRVVMKLFYYLGVKQLINKDMEADDLIYSLTSEFKKDPKKHITIISTDKDFHQLLCPQVKIFNTHTRLLIHQKNIKVQYGYEANQCVDFLCLTGDKSDNIKGYRGIGEAKALQLINQFGSIDKFLASDKGIFNIDKDKLSQIYKVNRLQIDLWYFHKLFVKGKDLIKFYKKRNPKFNKKGLVKICKKYNIKTLRKPEFIKNYK